MTDKVELNDDVRRFVREEVQRALFEVMEGETVAEFKRNLHKSLLASVPVEVDHAMRKQAVQVLRQEEDTYYHEARKSLIEHNRKVAEGSDQLKRVPFVKQDDLPAIYSLTPLVSSKAVYALQEWEIDLYCKGYGVTRTGNLEQDCKLINEAIGAIPRSKPTSHESTPLNTRPASPTLA